MPERMPRPSKEMIQRARELRKEMTPAERVLWERLRRGQVLGCHWRKQHPMGHFIADFYCDEAKLVIEVDGGVHLEKTQEERDAARDDAMSECGFGVLRFTNAEVLRDTDRTVEDITRYISTHRIGLPCPRATGAGAGGRGKQP
jgi:very-short-patch-repair endonuclease